MGVIHSSETSIHCTALYPRRWKHSTSNFLILLNLRNNAAEHDNKLQYVKYVSQQEHDKQVSVC
jgi:hypothetical protein